MRRCCTLTPSPAETTMRDNVYTFGVHRRVCRGPKRARISPGHMSEPCFMPWLIQMASASTRLCMSIACPKTFHLLGEVLDSVCDSVTCSTSTPSPEVDASPDIELVLLVQVLRNTPHLHVRPVQPRQRHVAFWACLAFKVRIDSVYAYSCAHLDRLVLPPTIHLEEVMPENIQPIDSI